MVAAGSLFAVTVFLVATLPLRGPLDSGVWYRADSGVFLYSGWRVLNGEVPYRDFWDHKGPAIYYVDALGLWLGGGSVWGVLLVEILALTVLCVLVWQTVARRYAWLVATFACAMLLAGVGLSFHGGNTVEEFALVFNMAAVFVFLRAIDGSSRWWTMVAVGALATIPALFRPNLVGVGIAIALTVVLTGIRASDVRLACIRLMHMMVGGALVVAITAIWFGSQGALGDLWEAVISYNLSYASAGPLDRLDSLAFGLYVLSPTGLPVLATAGWAMAVWRAIGWWRGGPDDVWAKFIAIGLPLEFGLAAVSGNRFPHYYLTVLPVATLAFAYLTGDVLVAVRSIASDRRVPGMVWLLAGAIAVAGMFATTAKLGEQVAIARGATYIQAEAVSWLDEHLEQGDTVLVWGNDASVNLFANAPSATKFFYQFPIFTGDHRAENATHMLAELQDSPPAFVIDTYYWLADPLFPSIDPVEYERWRDTVQGQPTGIRGLQVDVGPEAEAVIRFLQENYVPVDTLRVGAIEWTVYAWQPPS